LIVSILGLGGLQLMATGILGEYIGRLFIESKQRPLYLIDEYAPASDARSVAVQAPAAPHGVPRGQ
jgi:polyisoprenyl-phosphate glycosyltransferase